ncbi:SNF2-related protein [Oceanospirillum sediminis]|uniref:DEAD/DEAH box helicase family protein n=1 Tax=Oceanospirillum sediminis TaxID=2760088 RepID=A0A839IY49_9GAMM|nr:SNF2-related protein [Oceanospirillum sediminis]MBB1489307.1 DEAD/DEAH box helicase family protein [Oceanospirillum sediminis]
MSFKGWEKVSKHVLKTLESNDRLNAGQKRSVHSLVKRIPESGVIIADEVGMGKTRIAVELIRAVKKAGGRVLVVVPTTLGFQWQGELNDRAKDLAPKTVIKSLWGFLAAYESKEKAEPWDKEKVVILSQNFASWRMGASSSSSRWALLPEIYAQWRKKIDLKKRLPNGYYSHNDLVSNRAKVCAEHIVDGAKDLPEDHVVKETLDFIGENFSWGKNSFGGDSFSSGSENRDLLEKAVGLGLGEFDLIVIDEAHKSRSEDSSLSTILNRIAIKSVHARHLAMTATPVELGVGQWRDMLNRIELDPAKQEHILESVQEYAQAVTRLKQSWRADEKGREDFKHAAKQFEAALSPYLLRRDKRQDETIQKFHKESGLSINGYRKETPVNVEIKTLSAEWKRIVCAVEGLSASSSMQTDSTSKRARLTLANGHGIAGIIDKSLNASGVSGEDEALETDEQALTDKKAQRQAWWKSCIANAFDSGEESLYKHPAILKVIEEIEQDLSNGQKVLVFGKMTRPMRALVNLLNARAMLISLKEERYWPQSKIHMGDGEHNIESEVKAVEIALKQLELEWDVEKVNQLLAQQYNKNSRQVDKAKEDLLDRIELARNQLDVRTGQLFDAFKTSVNNQQDQEKNCLTPFANAIFELIDKEGLDFTPEELATGFNDLMNVVTAKHEGDENGDGELDAEEARDLWPTIEERVITEFAHVRGGMARLMYGGTAAHSRRVMQMGFNRQHSNPKVIVAQSVVGREGLNLHQACRVVYLLHPEWNPGVVEQQIGRIDRLGSRWEKEFEIYQADKDTLAEQSKTELPFIEIKPVIFKGTYDEYNWQVLDARWDELRSQLHGIILPESERTKGFEAIYDQLCAAAPDFSKPLP